MTETVAIPFDRTAVDPAMTVRDIVLAAPRSAPIFERLKIDYCCGGEASLAEACKAAGVEFATLQTMLAEAESSPADDLTAQLRSASLTQLITHILDKHHVYTKQVMGQLPHLFAKVIAAHAQNHPELGRLGNLFDQLCNDLRPHMMKEEMILFPYVIELERSRQENRPPPFAPFGTVQNPIRMMMMEHDMAGEVLREMREVSGDYELPGDACLSYRGLYGELEAFERDLHQHIHLENNLLFPKAVALESSVCE